jgi:hypothetical protein
LAFINGIDTIWNHLSKSNIQIIIGGDINMNYLADNCSKQQQLGNLLATYNLISTVWFPTRSTNGTISAVDNMFIDISHISRYTICSFINGLSDRDAQVIKLGNILTQNKLSETKITQNFNKSSIDDIVRSYWAMRPGIMVLMKMMLIKCLVTSITHI